MDNTPERCCQRCQLSLSETQDYKFDNENRPVHWAESDCISLLLDELTAMRSAESQLVIRLREQLRGPKATPGSVKEALQLSGTIVRMEEWLRRGPDEHSVEFRPVFGGRAVLCSVDSPIGSFEAEANTAHDALTAALDQADGV